MLGGAHTAQMGGSRTGTQGCPGLWKEMAGTGKDAAGTPASDPSSSLFLQVVGVGGRRGELA